MLDLDLNITTIVQVHRERVIANGTDVRSIRPHCRGLIVAIAEVKVIVELTIADLKLVHPLDTHGDKHSATITHAPDRFDHRTLNTGDSIADHVQELLVSNGRVSTRIRLANELVIIGTGEDLKRNLDSVNGLKRHLLDVPLSEPVVLKIQILVDLSKSVPAHVTGLLTIAISNSVCHNVP